VRLPVGLHPDRELVREVTSRPLGTVAEQQVWILSLVQAVREMPYEVAPLVDRWSEPDEVTIIEDRIEKHHSLDHPSRCFRLSEPAVGLSNRRPKRLVVNVEHPTAMQFPGRDRRGEAPLDEARDEVRALLAVNDAGEAAVLALDEDAGVQQHVQQETCLALGETERRDRLQALCVGQVVRIVRPRASYTLHTIFRRYRWRQTQTSATLTLRVASSTSGAFVIDIESGSP
jgi:hypothetical protein